MDKMMYDLDPIRIITHDDWRICEYDDDYGWWPSHQHDKKWYECIKNDHEEFICPQCHTDDMQFPPKALLTHIKLQKLKPKKTTERDTLEQDAVMNQLMQFAQMQTASAQALKQQQEKKQKELKQKLSYNLSQMSPPVAQTPQEYKFDLWSKLYGGNKGGKAKK
jgi:hypothetical protein